VSTGNCKMKKWLYTLCLISIAALAASPPIMPNHQWTPGAVDPKSTVDKICTPHYTEQVRDVPESVKKRVFATYGIDPASDHYEIDHLISLELGGSNDISNLWPQSYTTLPYNAHLKDHLENTLHSMVCKGAVDLATAQKAISTDWIAAYQEYVK